MARKCLVVANWKMHKTLFETREFISSISPSVAAARAGVLIAPSFTSIPAAVEAARKTNIVIGAQNMHDENEGLFTGEVSGLMLKEAGAEFVIIGHSERRVLFHEKEDFILRKILRALKDDLIPILCIGESEEERKQKRTEEILRFQLFSVFSELAAEDAQKITIAYEPIWAIGTGVVATPEIAEHAHGVIRMYLKELFSSKCAEEISILYGGSVNRDNFKALIDREDIDGALVGGASLDPKSFADIVNLC